ncbi:MAG TPA: hypothetical protein VM166_00645 [Gemmatimonadaceae bacterium]|nr:hypothetical protein [Gemmatimonadaceae bacterium]
MTQPWATLVAIGANVIETRDWPTKYRGPFAIHAAKGFPREARALCRKQPFRDALAARGYTSAEDLPLGAVVALVNLESLIVCGPGTLKEIRAQSKRGELPPHEADFGDFSDGRFGFVLNEVRRVGPPVPARGMLGFWTLPPDVEAEVRKCLRARISL